jgi:hypothetical protein
MSALRDNCKGENVANIAQKDIQLPVCCNCCAGNGEIEKTEITTETGFIFIM